MDSYIASCVIFLSIELIQGHYLSAHSLLKGAVKLFYDRTADPQSVNWPAETFERLLSRLQSQAVALLDPSTIGHTTTPRLSPIPKMKMPKQFKSVSEARQYFEFYCHSHTLSQASIVDRGTMCARENFTVDQDLVAEWSSAFEAMLEFHADTISDDDMQVANVLKIWAITMNNAIHVQTSHASMYDDQELWDACGPQHETVIKLAETVLEHDYEGTQEDDTIMHRFTLDFGLVGPLYDTARVCRDPYIRRKAIHLLRTYPRREGLWDSLLAARSAEREMELEESAVREVQTAADIPGWARISSALPTFHPGHRWASVVYTRQEPIDGSEPEKFYEVIEW
jgi:hypothetical protein